MIDTRREMPSWYDELQDKWVVVVPFSITQEQLMRVRDWLLKVQLERYRASFGPEKREFLKKSVDALRNGKVVQSIEQNDGGYLLFQSTERMGTTATFGPTNELDS